MSYCTYRTYEHQRPKSTPNNLLFIVGKSAGWWHNSKYWETSSKKVKIWKMYGTSVKKHCKRNSRMHDASWQSWTFPPVLFADRSSIKVSSCFSKRDSLSLSKFRSFSISWSQRSCKPMQWDKKQSNQNDMSLKQPSTAILHSLTKQSKLNGYNSLAIRLMTHDLFWISSKLLINGRHDHPLIGPPSACAAHPEGHWGSVSMSRIRAHMAGYHV